MGTRMVPSYAIIFMGELEKHLLQNPVNRPSIWWRYIDDIFTCLEQRQIAVAEQFLQEINTFHTTINFTAEWYSIIPCGFLCGRFKVPLYSVFAIQAQDMTSQALYLRYIAYDVLYT